MGALSKQKLKFEYSIDSKEVPISIKIKNESNSDIVIKGKFEIYLDKLDKAEQTAYFMGKLLRVNESLLIADFFDSSLKSLLEKSTLIRIVFVPSPEMKPFSLNLLMEKYFQL